MKKLRQLWRGPEWRRPLWMKNEHLAKLKWEKEAHRRWQQEQTIQEEYIAWAHEEMLRKAKTAGVETCYRYKKKGFHEYTGSKKRLLKM